MKFYKCSKCGQILTVFDPKCPGITCCGKDVTELTANTTDGAHEKHVPVIKVQGTAVQIDVGSAPHPMQETHLIEWILLETDRGAYRASLRAGDEPKAVFTLREGEKPVTAYAYCNQHGLWKADV